MGAVKNYKNIQHIAAAYKARLDTFSEEIFQQTPPSGSWSFSEVYFHIFDASILALQTIEDCIKGNGKRKPTAFVVKMILFFGSLPPGKKYQAPKRLAERLKKISKTEASELIDQFILQLDDELGNIKKADRSIKTLHPGMGYLNACQWLRFAEIHLKHHFKQLKRIEKSF